MIRRGRRVSRIVGLLDGHVGGIADGTVRAERGEKTGDAVGVGGVGGRVDPPVDERQAVSLDLAPLPAHAFPEPPVVIVIAGAARRDRSGRRRRESNLRAHRTSPARCNPTASRARRLMTIGGSDRPGVAWTDRSRWHGRCPPARAGRERSGRPGPRAGRCWRPTVRSGAAASRSPSSTSDDVAYEIILPPRFELQPDADRAPARGGARTGQERQVEAGVAGVAVEVQPLRPGGGARRHVGDRVKAIHRAEHRSGVGAAHARSRVGVGPRGDAAGLLSRRARALEARDAAREPWTGVLPLPSIR